MRHNPIETIDGKVTNHGLGGTYFFIIHPSIRSSNHFFIHRVGAFCPSPLVWLFGCDFLSTTHDCTTMQRGSSTKRLKIKICHNSTRASIATWFLFGFCSWRFFRKPVVQWWQSLERWSHTWMILHSPSKYGHIHPLNGKKNPSFMVIGGCSWGFHPWKTNEFFVCILDVIV